jgi:uncharacterized protein (DUF885 family)
MPNNSAPTWAPMPAIRWARSATCSGGCSASGVSSPTPGCTPWSRDQAIATLRDLQGFDAAFITIEADVDRMAAAPGKYAAESLGALSLAAWRPADRKAWPAFHKAVLADGPWPFAELETRVRA